MPLITDQIISLSPLTDIDLTYELISWLNDIDIMRHSRQRFKTHTLETSRVYLKSFNDNESLYVKIIEVGSNQMIGTMTAFIDATVQTADLGILIGNRSEWGKGYGLRAWNLMINYVFNNYDVVTITGGCEINNTKMIAILKKAGMFEYKIETLRDAYSEYSVIRYKINKDKN